MSWYFILVYTILRYFSRTQYTEISDTAFELNSLIPFGTKENQMCNNPVMK